MVITTTLNVPYRLEKPIHNSQMGISFQSSWRHIPLVLHEMKRVNLSISKAKFHDSWTTLYINSIDPDTHATIHRPHLVNVLQGRVQLDQEPLYNQGLHPSTVIRMFNLSNYPYTVLDFQCGDRVGLFCEILEFLTPYDIQIHHAYCNAQKYIASNMFFITNKQGNMLTPEEIEFFSNIFEYDLKKRLDLEYVTY